MILALAKWQNEDLRPLGELFLECYGEVTDIQFAQALELILSLLQDVLDESVFLADK